MSELTSKINLILQHINSGEMSKEKALEYQSFLYDATSQFGPAQMVIKKLQQKFPEYFQKEQTEKIVQMAEQQQDDKLKELRDVAHQRTGTHHRVESAREETRRTADVQRELSLLNHFQRQTILQAALFFPEEFQQPFLDIVFDKKSTVPELLKKQTDLFNEVAGEKIFSKNENGIITADPTVSKGTLNKADELADKTVEASYAAGNVNGTMAATQSQVIVNAAQTGQEFNDSKSEIEQIRTTTEGKKSERQAKFVQQEMDNGVSEEQALKNFETYENAENFKTFLGISEKIKEMQKNFKSNLEKIESILDPEKRKQEMDEFLEETRKSVIATFKKAGIDLDKIPDEKLIEILADKLYEGSSIQRDILKVLVPEDMIIKIEQKIKENEQVIEKTEDHQKSIEEIKQEFFEQMKNIEDIDDRIFRFIEEKNNKNLYIAPENKTTF